jgi:hypothetical protein
VKNVNPLGEPHRIYGPISVAPMVSDDLKYAGAKALQRLRALVFGTDLREIEAVAHFVLDLLRIRAKRRQRVAEPNHWLRRRLCHEGHDMLDLACRAKQI